MASPQIEACLRETLHSASFDGVREAIRPLDIAGLLAGPNLGELKRFRAALPAEMAADQRFERALLLAAAAASAGRVASLPVPEDVRRLLEDHFLALLQASPVFALEHPGFVAWARIVMLRRLPAGQLDFEYSGLPRSWLLKVRWRDLPRLAACVLRDLGGFRPCFFSHVAVRRKNRYLLVEAESSRSYYRIAQALRLQPEVRGLITASWFHSPDTMRVSPHLAWLNELPSKNGALIIRLGPAGLDSGVFERSPERRKLYEEGKFRPSEGLLVWPKRQLLDWADRHPEWGNG